MLCAAVLRNCNQTFRQLCIALSGRGLPSGASDVVDLHSAPPPGPLPAVLPAWLLVPGVGSDSEGSNPKHRRSMAVRVRAPRSEVTVSPNPPESHRPSEPIAPRQGPTVLQLPLLLHYLG